MIQTIPETNIQRILYDNKNRDYHMHSTYSDGDNSVDYLVNLAIKGGLNEIAITDHDTTSGYNAAKGYVQKNKIDMTIVPGVEITVKKYHILGLFIDVNNTNLQDVLRITREKTFEREKKRCIKIKNQGIPIDISDLVSAFPKTQRLSKRHISLYLNNNLHDYIVRDLGENYDYEDIFITYIGKNKHDGNKTFIEPKIAIDAIHNAGGQAYIAHPFKDINSMDELDELRRLGLDGVEIQPNYKEKNIPFIKYALRHELLLSYGSDYHTEVMTHRPMLKGEEQKNSAEGKQTENELEKTKKELDDTKKELYEKQNFISDLARSSSAIDSIKRDRWTMTSNNWD